MPSPALRAGVDFAKLFLSFTEIVRLLTTDFAVVYKHEFLSL